jgi:hypothetical protein
MSALVFIFAATVIAKSLSLFRDDLSGVFNGLVLFVLIISAVGMAYEIKGEIEEIKKTRRIRRKYLLKK